MIIDFSRNKLFTDGFVLMTGGAQDEIYASKCIVLLTKVGLVIPDISRILRFIALHARENLEKNFQNT